MFTSNIGLPATSGYFKVMELIISLFLLISMSMLHVLVADDRGTIFILQVRALGSNMMWYYIEVLCVTPDSDKSGFSCEAWYHSYGTHTSESDTHSFCTKGSRRKSLCRWVWVEI